MMTSTDIRKAFMDFFIAKGHTIVPSAPIVVKNDPTLMFTNAGMNQFKDYFLGNKKAPASRVADTQKCLRVSGKHNDLEEVGVDTYHHTMFEMLGNWSFGDPARPAGGYFKKEAIAWSWELLTKVYQLDKSRIYVTIFEGDAAEGLPKDEEAYAEWKKWVAEDRILMGNRKDNFWEMGDTGPCGPCTEIHYDTRPEANNDGHQLVNHDETGMVMEIWNNVFIQFNRKKDGSLAPLPAKHVDTGMGLERLVRVLQNKQSNYDTDIFLGTLQKIASITKIKYSGSDNKTDVAFRVLADHIRAICFTIADGQLPSNTGAGYVIRRILRRAVRYYYSYLSYQKPLLFQLVPVIAKQFENVFPEVAAQLEFVSKVIKEEEEAFLRTLEKGLKRVDDLIAEGKISGKDAFELYDTYGFPFDLTKLIAAENKLSVDEKEFASEMRLQKERSRSATTIDAEDWIIEKEGNNTFVGYDVLSSETALLKYRKIKTKGKELYQLVLEETPFYAESGGQVGDRGQLIFENTTVKIFDTKKDNDLIIHFADNISENLSGKV
ncbi:MAG: alanine--tRNA ligase, partial [Chitinophagaceae bacterium]|nr:alanine--tRNA ligase [Chitinophagaceae bacterium]